MFMCHGLQLVDIVDLVNRDQMLVHLLDLESAVNKTTILPVSEREPAFKGFHGLVEVLAVSSYQQGGQ